MLVDETVLSRTEQGYDVVVVGAGAAGLTLAEALERARLRVLVLEAGGVRESRRGRDDYRGTVAAGSLRHPRTDLYRVRALGGTSRIWGGRCLPFDPIDFAERDWVAHSGWPIPYADVAGRYPDALRAAEAGANQFDPAAVLLHQAELVAGLDGDEVRTTLERFSRPTNFWTRFGTVLTRSVAVHVLCDAAVTRVALAANCRTVEALEVVTRSGQRRRVTASAYVLAGGGLETTRLLFASNDVKPAGLGNGGDRLGRTYMSHLCTTTAVAAFDPNAKVAHDYELDPEGIYIRRRLWLTPEAQRRHRLLNTTFRTHLPDPGDAGHGDAILSAMFLAKSFVQREYAAKFSEGAVGLAGYGRHAGNILRQPVDLVRFTRMWLRKRVRASRKLPSVVRGSASNSYALEFHAEQEPNLASRVTLSGQRDRFGMPRLHVDWRISDLDVDSLRRSHALLDSRLRATGTGRLVMAAGDLAERVGRHSIVGGHHIGTTRMSTGERDGVVDRDCRVHGTANLYVASASVLPTSGQANPTLTVLALALRLADRLAEQLAPAPVVRRAA